MINQKEFETFLEENDFRMRIEDTNNLDENTNAENVEKVLYAFLNSSELKPKDY